MRSLEQRGFINFDPGDSDNGHTVAEINVRQMEKNGISILDFSNPPEGIELLGKPFEAESLWRNMSEPPVPRRR